MAVFMINICKYNGCGITFPRLAELIEHIEDVHIDYDPAVVEQKEASQPACIPLSYVLKFFTESSRRGMQNFSAAAEVRRRLLSAPKAPSIRSSTPTGSDVDDDDLMSPSEDSNDSWTTVEEYSSDYILRYGVKMTGEYVPLGPGGQDKPFACPVPGCKKRYKNVNGIKYHSKNGHKNDGKIKKAYKCQCGKSYKTVHGLKSHSVTHHVTNNHPSMSLTQTSSAALEPRGYQATPKMQGLIVTASPSHRPLNIIEGIDGNKLVRIYDNIKTKDLPSFSIPKHTLNMMNHNSQGFLPSGLVATPGSGSVGMVRVDRSPKVSVQSISACASYTSSTSNEMLS